MPSPSWPFDTPGADPSILFMLGDAGGNPPITVDIEARDETAPDADLDFRTDFVPDRFGVPCRITAMSAQDQALFAGELGTDLAQTMVYVDFPVRPDVAPGTRLVERGTAANGGRDRLYRAQARPDDYGRLGLIWRVPCVNLEQS